MTQPFSDNEYLFTSESVTEGHPDKIADQISDTVLDYLLANDEDKRNLRVAVETLLTTGLVVVAGEVRSTASLPGSRCRSTRPARWSAAWSATSSAGAGGSVCSGSPRWSPRRCSVGSPC